RVFLQIPAQFLNFDWSNRGNEWPLLLALNFTLARRGWLIDQTRACRGAPHTILFMHFQISEFEDEFLQWLGFRLFVYGNVRVESLSQRNQQGIHRCFNSTSFAADRNVNRLLTEEPFQHAKLRPVQRERNDREVILATLFAK